MNNLLSRTISGVVLIIIFAGSILLNEFSMLALMVLIYSISFFEFRSIFALKRNLLFFFTLFSGVAFLILNYLEIATTLNPGSYSIAAIVFVSLLLLNYILVKGSTIKEIGQILFAGIWLSASLSFYMALGWMDKSVGYQAQLLIILIVLIWVNDTAAYFFGSLFGKKPLAPSISPGKTWEGFLSGIVINGIAGYVIFQITKDYSAGFWIILAIVVSLGATAGDLFESKLKREANVKDSGNLIPGHGGFLDRFDSLIFSAPLFYLIFIIWNNI